ncbi:YjzD family protein [Bacillus subtilis]|uniref:YjzD family protein n=1 Tax=Bacillus subtilis TaxID=1423 RepID=UPI0040575F0A
MRYIIAFIWTFLLSHMACYLVASMNSVTYNFKTSSVIAVVLYVLIMVLAKIMPMNKNASQH